MQPVVAPLILLVSILAVLFFDGMMMVLAVMAARRKKQRVPIYYAAYLIALGVIVGLVFFWVAFQSLRAWPLPFEAPSALTVPLIVALLGGVVMLVYEQRRI